jgi:tol-pal system protein YbgF
MSKKLVQAAFLLIFAVAARSQVIEPPYDYGSYSVAKCYEFYRTGLLDEAEEKLIKTIESFPETPAYDLAVLLQAKIDLANNNYNLAIQRLTIFITERANSSLTPHAALERAYMAFEKGKYKNAEKYFLEAKKLADTEFLERRDSSYNLLAHYAVFWRAVSLAFDKKLDESGEVFNECVTYYRKGPYTDDALFALGLTEEMRNRFKIALTYYKTIEANHPYSNMIVASKIREVNNYIMLRDPSEALVTADKAGRIITSINTKDSSGSLYEPQSYFETAAEELLYMKGEAYNIAANYSKAIETFREFLATYKQSAILNLVRLSNGWALLNTADYSGSIVYFDEIIASEKDENSTVRSLASLYRSLAFKKSNNVEEALKELSTLSVQPGYPYQGNVLLELGQIYYEAGDFSNTARVLERGLRESNSELVSTKINLLLGASYMEQQRWSKAVLCYQDAEKIALKSSYITMPQRDWYLAESNYKMGISLVNGGSYSQAVSPLLKFIVQYPVDKRSDEATFWLAEAYYKSDMLNNAIETYTNLLDKYPVSKRREESWYSLGWSNFRMKKFKESGEAFGKMLQEFPESKYAVEVLSRQGDAFYVNRNFKKAAEAYEKAAKAGPKSEEGLYSSYQQCYALYKNGDYEKAITALLMFARNYPESSFSDNALYLAGWIRFQQKKYADAVEDFKYLINAYPSSQHLAKAYYAIGDSYYNIKNYEESIVSYRKVVDEYPDDPLAQDAMRGIQYCLRGLGKDNQADSIKTKYVELNPESLFAIESKFNKAQDDYVGGKYKDAVTEFNDFVSKYPENEYTQEAFFWLGRSYLNLGDLESAETAFIQLRKKFPDSEYTPQSYIEQAVAFKKLNRIESADSLFRFIEKEYPESQMSAQASFERAMIVFAKGDTLGAIAMFGKIAEDYPEMVFGDNSRLQIALYYRSLEKYDSALTEFAKLARRDENPLVSSEAQYRIGEIHLRLKNWEEALKAFKIVKDQYSDFPNWYPLALLNMGECYERLNNNEEAVKIYQSLVTLNPNNEYGRTAAKRIERLKNP